MHICPCPPRFGYLWRPVYSLSPLLDPHENQRALLHPISKLIIGFRVSMSPLPPPHPLKVSPVSATFPPQMDTYPMILSNPSACSTVLLTIPNTPNDVRINSPFLSSSLYLIPPLPPQFLRAIIPPPTL